MFKKLITWPARFYQGMRYAASLHDDRQRVEQSRDKLRYRGQGTKIENNVSISWPSRVRIGKQCLVQTDCILHSMGGIHIGDYVGIGSKSILVSFSHNYLRPKYLPYDNIITIRPIIIRDFVWIGFAAHIMPGVEIGEGAIVGMASVVSKNVPPLAVVAGNPAEVVGYRNKKQFELCKKEQKFAGPMLHNFFGNYKEVIPGFVKKKYSNELKELGFSLE